MKLILLLLFLNSSIFAADSHFKFVEPFDKKVTDTLVWDDAERADLLSDYVVGFMSIAPYVYSATKKEPLKRMAMVATGQIINFGLAKIVKDSAQRTRPDGSNTKSFFSGHTSTAFVGAGAICLDAPKEICISSLLFASTAGYLRVAAKKHWLTDVLSGATIGYINGSFVPMLIFGF